MTIRERLEALADPKNADFIAPLVPDGPREKTADIVSARANRRPRPSCARCRTNCSTRTTSTPC